MDARAERDSAQDLLYKHLGLIGGSVENLKEVKPVRRWEPSRVKRARMEFESRQKLKQIDEVQDAIQESQR